VRRIGTAAVLAMAAVLLLVPVSARAAEIGTVPDVSWGTSSTNQDRTVSLMQEAGIQWARMNIAWNSIEPDAKGSINAGYIAEIDRAVDKVHAAGIDIVMPMGDGTPYWASSDPNKYVDSSGAKHWNVHYPASNFQDYADAFRYVVNHYKARGVHVYEVWNEPNHSWFWPSGPDPQQYTQMLKAAYPAIKAADPTSVVLGGALSDNDDRFLQGIYDAGGANYFDAVSTHSYPHGDPSNCWDDAPGHHAKEAFCSIENIRNTMVANGDSAKQIWLDELGWSTCSNAYSGCYGTGVTESQQAAYITTAFQELEGYPWVKAAFVYNFRSNYWGSESPDNWGDNLGLLHKDFTKKPAFDALKAYAQNAATSGGNGTGTGGGTGTTDTGGGTGTTGTGGTDTGGTDTGGGTTDTGGGTTDTGGGTDTGGDTTGTDTGGGADAGGTDAGGGATDVSESSQPLTQTPLDSGVELVFKVAQGGRRAAGQVVGASSGQVVVSVQRRSGPRWTGATRRQAEIGGDGSFSVAFGRGLAHGRFRAIAIFTGDSDQRSPVRSIRYFRAR
jgi:hypothetical protein